MPLALCQRRIDTQDATLSSMDECQNGRDRFFISSFMSSVVSREYKHKRRETIWVPKEANLCLGVKCFQVDLKLSKLWQKKKPVEIEIAIL